MLATEIMETAVIAILHQQRVDAAQIPQEAFGNLGIADDTAGDRGHIRRERIAAPRGEFGRQVRRPVLHPGFVAVDHRTGEIALAEALHRREHLGEILVEVERSEEHTSELQSLMRISYAVFCLKKKK